MLKALGKSSQDYRAIHNHVVALEKEEFVERDQGDVLVLQNEKSQKLYNLIHFCMKNGVGHNFMFRKSTLDFIVEHNLYKG